MNKNIKQKWLKELRSAESKQCRHSLLDRDGSCCALGALCKVFIRDEKAVEVVEGKYLGVGLSLNGRVRNFTRPPKRLLKAAGLCGDDVNMVVYLNDDACRSFKEIADYIEANL